MEDGKKYFIVPPEAAVITEYSEALETVYQHRKEKFTMTASASVVAEREVGMMASILAAAQHKKKWIDMLIFGIDFEFYKGEETEKEIIETRKWKTNPEYQKWFCHLFSRTPFSVFFIRDEDARLFALQGDFLYDMLRNSEGEIRNGKIKVEVPAEKIQLINNRLYLACVSFYTYCSGMHIDAEGYIEALIAEMRGNFSFKQVYKDCIENEYKIELAMKKKISP